MTSCNAKKLTKTNKKLEVISVNPCPAILQQYLDFERKKSLHFHNNQGQVGGFCCWVFLGSFPFVFNFVWGLVVVLDWFVFWLVDLGFFWLASVSIVFFYALLFICCFKNNYNLR